MYAA